MRHVSTQRHLRVMDLTDVLGPGVRTISGGCIEGCVEIDAGMDTERVKGFKDSTASMSEVTETFLLFLRRRLLSFGLAAGDSDLGLLVSLSTGLSRRSDERLLVLIASAPLFSELEDGVDILELQAGGG